MGSYKYLAKELEAKLERAKNPKLVPNCCIYRVPQKIRKSKPVAYTPQVVSIGPLHHGNKRLEQMEELKLGYLKCYLESTKMKLEDSIEKLKEKEEIIRACYAEIISQSSDDFITIILIDACFIIEYFLRFIEPHEWIGIDPILSRQSWWNDIKMDLILLENQLPFFVFKDLFFVTCINGRQWSSFPEVCFYYFRLSYTIVDDKLPFTFDYLEVEVQHFTDLLRMFYLPYRGLRSKREVGFVKRLYSASRLMEAGLKLKVGQNESLTELQYEKGVLTMPHLLVNDNTETFFRNMAALEQCHYPLEAYISDYLILLDFLIDERKDVDVLVDKAIMFNTLGDNDKVVAIFNNICRGMIFGSCNVDYIKLAAEDLNSFYERPLHKYKAIFIRDYFSTPWKIASFIAAIVLLLLTLTQTICSIISLL